MIFYYVIGFSSSVIAVISQLFLKKAADSEHSGFLKKFLNARVIFGYFLMVLSLCCCIVAQQKIDMKAVPIFDATGFIWVAILSYVFIKERPSKRRWTAVAVIFLGILVFSGDVFFGK